MPAKWEHCLYQISYHTHATLNAWYRCTNVFFYTGYNGEADDTQWPMDHMLAASDNDQDPGDELQFMDQEEDILLIDQQNGDVADQRIADDTEEMNALQRDNLLTDQTL